MSDDTSEQKEAAAPVTAGDADAAEEWYSKRRRRLVVVAWFMVVSVFITTVVGFGSAFWEGHNPFFLASSFAYLRFHGGASTYPGETPRVLHTWQLSRSHHYAEALKESEAIVLDPKATPEERCTSEAHIAYNAWRLGQTEVAAQALAEFEKQSPALKIDPGMLEEGRRMKFRLSNHISAKDVNPISGIDWVGEKGALQNEDFAAGLAGWALYHDIGRSKYTIGSDPIGFGPGKPCAFLSSDSAGDQDWNSLVQTIVASKYLGQRVQLTAWLKADNVSDTAYLWMRVETPSVNYFARVPDPRLAGTTDWQQEQIVLDIPQDAQGIALGEVLIGPGKASLADVSLYEVRSDTPTTPTQSSF